MNLPKITPALYGLIKLGCKTVKNDYQQFVIPLLNKEETIFQAVFSVCHQQRMFGFGKKKTMRLFFEIVETLNANPQQTVLEDAFDAIFNAYYFTMVESEQYWEDGRFDSGNHIEYQEAIDKWKIEHKSRVQLCEEELKKCLNET